MQLAIRFALAAVLAAAALLKLTRPRASAAGLATFGIPSGMPQWAALGGLATLELALAAGVALGSDAASYAAAVTLAAFGAAMAVAWARGRAGMPCGCFGARSRVGTLGIVRNLALAAAFASLPWLPSPSLGTDGWLAVGLAVSLAGVFVLGVAVAALAREVGMLRLRLTPSAALEIPDEGPPVGESSALIERFSPRAETPFALAVFSSERCRVCESLRPSVAALARDPLVSVEIFDEERDADVWEAASVPGSPFAVALERDGTVRAKGTFNSLAELEGILAAAERRSREAVHA